MAVATADEIITSVRGLIPDPVADNDSDGAFSASLIRQWINDAMDEISGNVPCVLDWSGVQSIQGMDLYEMDSSVLTIQQLWYDLWPCWQTPELDTTFVTKVGGRSYFFGPHSVGAFPRLHVWPACDRTGLSTTLSAGITSTATTIGLTSVTGLKDYGYLKIDNEIITYRTLGTSSVSNVLRGQAGTTAASHLISAPVTELNIMFKFSRLATHVTSKTSVIEIPKPLIPLIEMYVMANVRQAEQEYQESRGLRKEFEGGLKKAADSLALKTPRQGMQVRSEPPGPYLYFGRVYVP